MCVKNAQVRGLYTVSRNCLIPCILDKNLLRQQAVSVVDKSPTFWRPSPPPSPSLIYFVYYKATTFQANTINMQKAVYTRILLTNPVDAFLKPGNYHEIPLCKILYFAVGTGLLAD
jgi:hypothetical protein